MVLAATSAAVVAVSGTAAAPAHLQYNAPMLGTPKRMDANLHPVASSTNSGSPSIIIPIIVRTRVQVGHPIR